MGKKKPTDYTPGLFGYNVPVDGSASETVSNKQKSWEDTADENPMVRAYGRHEDHTLRCKDCDFLYWRGFTKKYFKCVHSGNAHGDAIDHHKHWPACSKLEPITNKSHEII